MLASVGDVLLENGFDYRHAYADKTDKFAAKGLIGTMISTIMMCLEIVDHPSDNYFMLWEDDIVINRQKTYQELISVELPSDATMIAFHMFEKNRHEIQGHARHPTLPFWIGTHGVKTNQAIMLTKQGAQTILDTYRKDTPVLGFEMFFERYWNLPGLYFSDINFCESFDLAGAESDIHVGHTRTDYTEHMYIYYEERPIGGLYAK